MTSRFFTKPVVCITFPCSEVFAQHSADVVGHTAGCSTSAEQRIIDAVELNFPKIQCYVEHRNNQPVIKMSRTARRLCGNVSDAEIAAVAGVGI